MVKQISQGYQMAKKESQAGTLVQCPHLPRKHHAASWDTGAAASFLCLLIGQTLTPLPPSLFGDLPGTLGESTAILETWFLELHVFPGCTHSGLSSGSGQLDYTLLASEGTC